MARVADWCTACHFFPLFQAKWLASPRLRTISFDAKLFCPWNVANLTLLMEYKLKWRMSHLPYLFKRKIFAVNLTFFIVSRMVIHFWSHRLGLAKKERTTDSSVWAAQTAQFYSLESSDSECMVSIPGLCSSFLTSLTSTPSRLRSSAICNSFLFLKHARWPQSFCIHFSLELSSLQVCT